VTYQCQYFTINSSISKCDHQCETRNAEPEIRTDGSSHTWQNTRVGRYGSGIGPQRVCRSGFWTVLEPNPPVFAVQTRTTGGLPGPLANTNDKKSWFTPMEVLDFIYHQFFFTANSLGHQPTTSQYFQPLTLQTLALAAAAIHCELSEYASGQKATVMFSQDKYQGTFAHPL
jgi:hypothetical protein